MKTKGRPVQEYRLSLDFLLGQLNDEADIIIKLYNRFLLTHKEARELINRTLTSIEMRRDQ
jgi:predicted transcriptional regulator